MKLVTALLYPASIVVIAAVLSWFLSLFKKSRLSRLCAIVSVGVFLLSSNVIVSHRLAYLLEKQYPQRSLDLIKKHDAIIVLGGGLRLPTAPAKHTQLSSGSDRYWYATQLYKAGKAEKIIISAGNIITQPGIKAEAVYAKELLMLWGVPADVIIAETLSRNTSGNLQAVSTLLQKHNVQSALLVTSALHMPRAFSLFKSLPASITPASADVLIREANSINGLQWIPSASAMQISTVSMHEYYGIWYGQLKAFIDSF